MSISTAPLFSSTILKAFEFAAHAHHGQSRKGGGQAPYISHSTAVAFMLGRAGFSDAVVMAGVLHDVVEDTSATIEEIEQGFGHEVAQIVAGVSEDKSIPYAERKIRYIEQIRTGSPEVKAVSCADKIANLTSILMEVAAGEKVFETIWKTGPQSNMDFYIGMIDAVKGLDNPIAQEFITLSKQFIEVAKKHITHG